MAEEELEEEEFDPELAPLLLNLISSEAEALDRDYKIGVLSVEGKPTVACVGVRWTTGFCVLSLRLLGIAPRLAVSCLQVV